MSESDRVRVKICGITRPQDAVTAAELGVDAIGLVFHESSPRAVDVQCARDIAAAVPAFVTVVGLFVNAAAPEVSAILDSVPIELLQFHGQEGPEYCAGFQRRYVKAVSMKEGVDVRKHARRYSSASALLLDTYHDKKAGGVGRPFDWGLIPSSPEMPIVLAGGLTVDNVADAILQVQPYAVDVSGGVEAEKGIKDAVKMAAFIEEVRSVEIRS